MSLTPEAAERRPWAGRGRYHRVLLVGTAMLGAVLYAGALHNPFVYDDYRLIVENPTIQTESDLTSVLTRDIIRPLVTLSYAFDTAVWGHDPFGYHVTSVVLHGVNVALVFWLSLLLAEDWDGQRGRVIASSAAPAVVATATALVFAVHPMMTQAVGYISARSEVLYGGFFILAFLAGRRWMLAGGLGCWLVTVLLWIASLLAKESAVMLPVVLVAYDWLVHDVDAAERRRRAVRLALPMALAAMIAGALRLALLRGSEYQGWTMDSRFVLVAVDAFWRYLGLLVAPTHQSIFHAVPMPSRVLDVRVAADVLGLVALAWVVWRLRRRHGLVAFGLAWFTLLMVPSSVLFALGIGEPLAEHRAYVASVGVFLAFGSGCTVLWNRLPRGTAWRRVTAGLAIALVARFGLQTMIRNAIWSDPVMLSREATELAPDHWVPRVLLAEAYRHAGNCARAMPEYEAAITLQPREPFAYPKLAGCLIEARRLDEAQGTLVALQRVNPASQEASMGLGMLAVITNRTDDARRYFHESLARDPSSAQARRFSGLVDGTLAGAERLELCRDLQAVADARFDFDGCAYQPPAR